MFTVSLPVPPAITSVAVNESCARSAPAKPKLNVSAPVPPVIVWLTALPRALTVSAVVIVPALTAKAVVAVLTVAIPAAEAAPPSVAATPASVRVSTRVTLVKSASAMVPDAVMMSVPLPPLMVSWNVKVPAITKVSISSPPLKLSIPVPAVIWSLPAPPTITSLPAPPVKLSAPPPPVNTNLTSALATREPSMVAFS